MESQLMDNTHVINPMDVPARYLDKYQRSGPRYTSYPTAPQFKPQFEATEIETLWSETNSSDAGISIYTHFPFCRSRCLYCGCYTHIGKPKELQLQYVEALKKEADRLFTTLDPKRIVRQMAFGGGTPTHLPVEVLSGYVEHLNHLVQFAPDAERSIEIDPRSVDEDYLQRLLDLGFNRFSFGVQDLDVTVQKNIHRMTSEEKLTTLIDYLRSKGMEAINLDLIYGLPGQTPESFSATVEKIVAYRPSRIALFGYAHVPWVSPHQKVMEKHQIPNTEERMVLFGKAFELLTQAGYEHIGMDHFALSNDELLLALKDRTLTRNFMGYTTRRGLDLVGIGASSISSVGKTYAQNVKELDQYCQNTSGLHWQKALVLSPEDLLRREIIMDLFCNFYLNIAAVEMNHGIVFKDHFATELAALKPMADDDLIDIKENELVVTQLGRFFIRNICMVFDQYLAKDIQNPDKRYSKTL
jgi:oxygen-independent coproporphyrinogen III oxidase